MVKCINTIHIYDANITDSKCISYEDNTSQFIILFIFNIFENDILKYAIFVIIMKAF